MTRPGKSRELYTSIMSETLPLEQGQPTRDPPFGVITSQLVHTQLGNSFCQGAAEKRDAVGHGLGNA